MSEVGAGGSWHVVHLFVAVHVACVRVHVCACVFTCVPVRQRDGTERTTEAETWRGRG